MEVTRDLFGGVHVTTLYRSVDHVTQCIISALGDVIHWPTEEERKSLYGWVAVYDKVIGFLDGTHCPIKKPTREAKVHYSTYKHKHSQNFLVVVNPFALVTFIAGPYPGRGNDRSAFNQCSLATNYKQMFSEGEVLVADGGFMRGRQLLVPVHADVISHAESEGEKEDLLLFNEVLSEGRVLVEDVFSWLKARARVLQRVFPRSRRLQRDVFIATCYVYNYIRMLRMEYAQEGKNEDETVTCVDCS